VYFAEWDEPMISGIGWVSEPIEAAGGIDIFADRTGGKSAEEIIARAPDIIIGSWCGKKFRPEKVTARLGLLGTRRVVPQDRRRGRPRHYSAVRRADCAP
jgi:ABC-type Fe3+-hydroxamate transport system substrate-binding protein